VRKRIALKGTVLAFLFILPATGNTVEVRVSDKPLEPPEGGEYTGSVSCKNCHPVHYRTWFLSPHARAFQSLKQKSEKADARCLRCHTTGFRGRFDPNLVGVQCEACHGPSSRHAATGNDSSPIPTPGLKPGCRDCEFRKICMLCHTPKESPDFDFNSYYKRIRHDTG
jgi:hypothetical protein